MPDFCRVLMVDFGDIGRHGWEWQMGGLRWPVVRSHPRSEDLVEETFWDHHLERDLLLQNYFRRV